MFSSASSTYSLKRPARCIAALASSEEPSEEQQNISSRFLVGTCSLREGNELHILGFHEESNELLCHQVGCGASHALGEGEEVPLRVVRISESKPRARAPSTIVRQHDCSTNSNADRTKNRRFRRTYATEFSIFYKN